MDQIHTSLTTRAKTSLAVVRPLIRAAAGVAAAALLVACGQKGPLVLPSVAPTASSAASAPVAAGAAPSPR